MKYNAQLVSGLAMVSREKETSYMISDSVRDSMAYQALVDNASWSNRGSAYRWDSRTPSEPEQGLPNAVSNEAFLHESRVAPIPAMQPHATRQRSRLVLRVHCISISSRDNCHRLCSRSARCTESQGYLSVSLADLTYIGCSSH